MVAVIDLHLPTGREGGRRRAGKASAGWLVLRGEDARGKAGWY